MKQKKGQWYEISTAAARDKVSHALRFAAKQAGDIPLLHTTSTSFEMLNIGEIHQHTRSASDSALAEYLARQRDMLRSQAVSAPPIASCPTTAQSCVVDYTPLDISQGDDNESVLQVLRSAEVQELLNAPLGEEELQDDGDAFLSLHETAQFGPPSL